MNYSVTKEQYIYVNSKNRKSIDFPYLFSIEIPAGVFECDPEELFRLTCIEFAIKQDWFLVNRTNSSFDITVNGQRTNCSIDLGNFNGKQLASAVSAGSGNAIDCIYDSRTNQLKFAATTQQCILHLDVADSCAAVLGMRSISYTMIPNTYLTADYALSPVLSDTINLHIDNLTQAIKFQSVENKRSQKCENTFILLSLQNTFAPFDRILFSNPNDIFQCVCADNKLESLTFSLRDQDRNLMKFIGTTNWTASIKVETLTPEKSYEQRTQMMRTLKSIEEYMRLLFVSNNIRN